jgi:hypothetical protein
MEVKITYRQNDKNNRMLEMYDRTIIIHFDTNNIDEANKLAKEKLSIILKKPKRNLKILSVKEI